MAEAVRSFVFLAAACDWQIDMGVDVMYRAPNPQATQSEV